MPWQPTRPPMPLAWAPGQPLVTGLRVRLYPNAGLRMVATIAGVTHGVSAHRASPTDPKRIPASAWCRTCQSAACAAAQLAMIEAYRWRDDWDGPTGRYAIQGRAFSVDEPAILPPFSYPVAP